MDETLTRAGLFQGVNPEAVDALSKELEHIEVKKGQTVFTERLPDHRHRERADRQGQTGSSIR